MALDKNLALADVGTPVAPPCGWATGSNRGSGLFWASSVPGLDAAEWSEIVLVVATGGRAQLAAALAEGWQGDTSPYAAMQRHGILAVSPGRRLEDGVLLAGGSYSTVSLHINDGCPIVRKRLALDGRLTADRELRQMQEIKWLAALPSEAAELFAPVLGATHSAAELELRTAFVPGYTLAELVFQGRIEGPELAVILEHIYATVSATLWSRPASAMQIVGARENYLERVRRRVDEILASDYPREGILRAFFAAESVNVNGSTCLGVEAMLSALEGDPRWDPVVNPKGHTQCHGDLILEDVLISAGAKHGFALVDPNPANQSAIYDLGKTMMSLWLEYEPYYFDRFNVECEVLAGGGVALEVETTAPEVSATYREAADRFMPFVERELIQYLALPPSRLRASLRMGAAIHMLAITVFHLLHHGSEGRALAFASTALQHAQTAFDEA